MSVQVKRAYEPPAPDDGYRVLVDRVWPRGIARADLRIDGWLKELAPSAGLRRWFGHDPARWEEFRRRYALELEQHEAALQALAQKADDGPLTLVFGARDIAHNNAVALKEQIVRRRRR